MGYSILGSILGFPYLGKVPYYVGSHSLLKSRVPRTCFFHSSATACYISTRTGASTERVPIVELCFVDPEA